MNEITEYQKVAALVCLDIDTIVKAAESKPELAMDFLLKLRGMKDKVVDDEKNRDTRYAACQSVFFAGL